ncbi:MAG: 3-phosphoshikimate 1-carboxyvinyltransferase [Chloroflexi bacterium]|nr:3-phosphoshikimate 1-carboxyvinyltransferase [Chloroflexota bacterium]
MNKTVSSPSQLNINLTPPGDKSIAHRSVLFNSLARGKAEVSHFCGGADCLSTIRCMRSLGVKIKRAGPERIEISSAGAEGFLEPANVLNAGNSGTTTRLLSGLLAGQDFLAILTGDSSLRSRPMGRIIKPLRLMGGDITGRKGGLYAPLVIKGSRLRGIDYSLPEPSAQVKSALILAGLFAEGKTEITEPAPTRDHTERMLAHMGAPLSKDGAVVTVRRLAHDLKPLSFTVPGDISAAAYWLVAGAVHPNARVTITACGLNPTRTGVIDILSKMGANISVTAKGERAAEPVGDVTVESSELRGVDLAGDIIVRAIDEVPVIAVAACFAMGTTTIRSADELRVKESDRIAQTTAELRKLGANIRELPDGMVITGTGRLTGNTVDSHSDHRLAMSMAVAGLAAEGTTTIIGSEAAAISYPAFWDDLEAATGK